MAVEIIDRGPDEATLEFTPGDDLIIRFEYGTDITGRTYTAGITDDMGGLVQALTCTIANAALGYIDMTLSETLSAALQTNGKKPLNYSWYFTETNGTETRTMLAGKVILRYK